MVSYMTGSVDYVQTITVKNSKKLTGSHEYQVCNDMLCLPPKTKTFAINLK